MPMTPLGQLIEECRQQFADTHKVGLSYGDIARRSRVLTRGRVQQIATGPIKELPSAATLHGLAAGLQVPYSVVLGRALQSAGYVPQDHEDAGARLSLVERREHGKSISEALETAEERARLDSGNRHT